MTKKILTLDNIPVIKKNVGRIDTIEKLKASTIYSLGDVVEVLGFHAKGDGSHHKRIAKAEDDGSGEQGQNGIWWCVVHSGEVNVSWFGAIGDGVADDTIPFQKAIDFGVVVLINKRYKITNTLYLHRRSCLKGSNPTDEFNNNTSNIILSTQNKIPMFAPFDTSTSLREVKLINILFEGGQKAHFMKQNWLPASSGDLIDMIIKDCSFQKFDFVFGDNTFLRLDWSGGYVNNCTFETYNHCIKIRGADNYIRKMFMGSNPAFFIGKTKASNYLVLEAFAHSYLEDLYISSIGCDKASDFIGLENVNFLSCIFDLTYEGALRVINSTQVNFVNCKCGYNNSVGSTYLNAIFNIYDSDNVNITNMVMSDCKTTGKNAVQIRETVSGRTKNVNIIGLVIDTTINAEVYKNIVNSSTITHIGNGKVNATVNGDVVGRIKGSQISNLDSVIGTGIDKSLQINILSGGSGTVPAGSVLTFGLNSNLSDVNLGFLTQIISNNHATNSTAYDSGLFYRKGISGGGFTNLFRIATTTAISNEAYTLEKLDTPYYTLKMQQEEIYADYVAYRDELHEYENNQVSDDTMLLPVLQEHVIPESVKAFAEKYKLI